MATLKERFDALKGTKLGKLLAFLLILLISTALLYVSWLGCIIVLLIPVSAFGVQYLFGERNLKWLIIIGILALVVVGIIFGALLAQQTYDYRAEPLKADTDDGVRTLDNGTFVPRTGDANQRFNFTVEFYDEGGGLPQQKLVNIWSSFTRANDTYEMAPSDPADNDSTNGKTYYFETTLPEDLHYFRFIFQNASGKWATAAGTLYGPNYQMPYYEQGPINLPVTQLLSESIVIGLYNTVFLLMIFLLLVMLYWWTKKSRTYAPPPKPSAPGKAKEEFTCSKCGADVPGDAVKCPKCGEAFEDDRERPEKEKEAEAGTCRVCNAPVKKGELLLGCQCGRAYHLRCAQKVGKCPACGTEFKA